MSQNNQKGHAHIYLAGGAGANIGYSFETKRGVEQEGYATFDLTYVDTSMSNLKKKSVDPKNIYLIPSLEGEELDGSGKIRGENHPHIAARIKDILHVHRPGDFAIVTGSCGGGSGSVIAPLLVAELISREVPTIVIGVGSHSSRADAKNTLNTLKSYQSIAEKAGVPIIMAYYANQPGQPQAQVDELIRQTISSILVLASRQNEELDSKDVFNWLRTDKTTTYADTYLAALRVASKASDFKKLGNVMSVATLVANSDQDPTYPGGIPDIQFKGIMPQEVTKNFKDLLPLHFVISDGLIVEEYKVLEGIMKGLNDAAASRPQSRKIVVSDAQTDDGLVL